METRFGESTSLGREVANDCYLYFYFSKTSVPPLPRGDKDCILPTGFRFFPILDPLQPASVSISSPQGLGQRRGLSEFPARKMLLGYL